jgi:phenylalanyl-tRNA synthetase beta chain
MKISLNWLSDYIDLSGISVDDIAHSLTDLGLEVESVEKLSPLTGDVVVGKVLEANPHPNADSLRLCKVDIGRSEPLTIVCGAPNARTGITVAVATVGSVLPGDFKIKSTKIRGEKSDGMMCSERELGMGETHEGIIEIQNPVNLGSSIAELFQLTDTVFTLGLTPNRSDCLGYVGVARDLAARFGRSMRNPLTNDQAFADPTQRGERFKTSVQNADICPRFAGCMMDQVKVLASPAWLQRRLNAAGMRPVNNIVDVTNYVMLETGQPIHAYDERDIAGHHLIARLARADETIETLDGKSYQLVPSDIVIADDQRVVGLAGVMGGKNSEIRSDSTCVIIEVANFDSIAVRKTSRRLGIHTEASHRFERGVDLMAVRQVLHRVAALLVQISQEADTTVKPVVVSQVVDIFPTKPHPSVVALRLERLKQVSGISSLDADKVKLILTGLGLRPVDQKDGRLLFEIPSWRHDLEREIDLIEEVIRVNGINEVPYRLPVMNIAPTYESPSIDFLESSRVAMARLGFSETISFPFIGEAEIKALRIDSTDHWLRQCVTLRNPIAAEHNLMQTTGIINMIRAVRTNRRQGRKGCRIFEIGRAYFNESASGPLVQTGLFSADRTQGMHASHKALSESRAFERNLLCGILDQPFRDKDWQSEMVMAGFFHGKSNVQAWLRGMGIPSISFRPIIQDLIPFLHPGAAASVFSGEKWLGFVGVLHPEVAVNFELDAKEAPVVFELQLDHAFESRQARPQVDSETKPFPPTTRDLALMVSRTVPYQSIDDAFIKFRRRNLKAWQLFDVYQGSNIGTDKKSMAFSLSFQSAKRTLTDKEVDAEIEILLKHLNETVGASLR